MLNKTSLLELRIISAAVTGLLAGLDCRLLTLFSL